MSARFETTADIDAQARIRELEEQVAAFQAARMPHVPENVDPVIRALVTERIRRGMSRRDVVHTSGCSSASVSQWERGVSSPTLAKLRAWAEALDMTLDVRVIPPVVGEPGSEAADV